MSKSSYDYLLAAEVTLKIAKEKFKQGLFSLEIDCIQLAKLDLDKALHYASYEAEKKLETRQ